MANFELNFQHISDGTELTIRVLEPPSANGLAALVDMLPTRTWTLPVFIQDEWMEANSIAEAVLLPGLGDFHAPHIIISSDVYALLLNEDDDAVFTLLHETGHFVNGDLDHVCSFEDETNRRIQALEEGTVAADELAADDFAAQYMGPESALWGLQLREDRRMSQAYAWNTRNHPIEHLALIESQRRQDALIIKYGLYTDDEDDEE